MSNQITPDELRRRFPGASKSTLARNVERINEGHRSVCEASRSESERPFCDESLATQKGEAGNAKRLRVSIISYRRRLIDPDNLCPKYFVDCCRYAQIIPNDRAQDIALEVSQVKVLEREQEGTVIKIEVIHD